MCPELPSAAWWPVGADQTRKVSAPLQEINAPCFNLVTSLNGRETQIHVFSLNIPKAFIIIDEKIACFVG